MQCANHGEKEAAGVCNYCGKSICADCHTEIRGEIYCKDCLALKTGKESKEARSPALAAILSFVVAGLGQIYNGQIGKGLLIFFTSWLFIPWILGIMDAYKTADKINQGQIQCKGRPGCLIAFIIGAFALWIVIGILILGAAVAVPFLLHKK